MLKNKIQCYCQFSFISEKVPSPFECISLLKCIQSMLLTWFMGQVVSALIRPSYKTCIDKLVACELCSFINYFHLSCFMMSSATRSHYLPGNISLQMYSAYVITSPYGLGVQPLTCSYLISPKHRYRKDTLCQEDSSFVHKTNIKPIKNII